MSDIEIIEEKVEEVVAENVEVIDAPESYSAVTFIKRQDLIDFNLYLGSRSKSYGILIGGALMLGFGVYGFITEKAENLATNILFCLLGILSFLFVFVFSKIILKKRILKLDLSDMPPVEVVVSNEGILYRFEEEARNEGQEMLPFGWHLVHRVVASENHIYIHMVDYRTVLLLVKSDVENTKAYSYLKEKIQTENKWIEK